MGARKVPVAFALDCVKLQRRPFEHPSASRITIRLALKLAGNPYDLSASSNASRITIRLADECSKYPHCVFCALDYVKSQREPSKHSSASRMLQRGPSEHPSTSRITIRLALELVGKPYDLSAISNATRLTIRLTDGCLEGPHCIFSILDCVKLQRGSSEHPSASPITIRFALEIAGKPYDLSASSNSSRITKRLLDECSKDPRCVFSALNCVKLQRKFFEHPSANRIIIRLALELSSKPYDLPASSNANRITKRLALELACKPYDLPTSSNAKRITKRRAHECSEDPLCVFSALDCEKLQRESFDHPSASRITIRLALELSGKPYDLPTSSNANRLTIRLVDECSEDRRPRCIFNALECVKLQRGSSEHTSASRITIPLALELTGKTYDLLANSNARRITKRLADECSEDPHCANSNASRLTIRLTYDLLANSNASRLTIRLTYGCSEDPRCAFSVLNCVKLQRAPSEHPSASRIIIRLALELVGKPYDLSASSNASRLTIRLTDGCSEGPRCIFSALDCVKLQRGPSEHPSASPITIRFALEIAGKTYDLSASSNSSCITKRLPDGCSKDPRCVFSALNCVKLQRKSFEHPSANRIIIRLALELYSKPYDLPASSNANRITKRLADGCSKAPIGKPYYDSITIRLALELAGKTYDLLANSNASRLTIRLAFAYGCSEDPRCVFSVLNCVKLQRGPSEHPSISRITIRLALELVGKPYDLSASSNASWLTIRLTDGCSEGPHCIFSALNCVKLQRGPFEHPSASPITIRFALEIVGKPYDLSASSNSSRITKRLPDECSKDPRCVFSALDCVKLQCKSFQHPSANRIIIRLALELSSKPYDLPASSNANRITKRLADGCSKGPHRIFNSLKYVKLQRGYFEHSFASRITICIALELAGKPYDLPVSSNAKWIIKRLADECSLDLMQAALPNGLPMGVRKVRVAFSVL
ncbi:hypothetical protein L7F22_040655 [Adiantum nelumboides]|nr:hypothetical protein [Adiantum nelumboides]